MFHHQGKVSIIREKSPSLKISYVCNIQILILNINLKNILYVLWNLFHHQGNVSINMEKSPHIIELDLDGNELAHLNSRPFKGLGKLTFLAIKNNKLVHFTRHCFEGFYKFKALEYFYQLLENQPYRLMQFSDLL